ncbi:MAG: hypothetical protein JWO94_3211, partial [Verrucomicrobiaceae bacterium]|nr:hypothetical protein [Verrucomicrobiaceae bacterium]
TDGTEVRSPTSPFYAKITFTPPSWCKDCFWENFGLSGEKAFDTTALLKQVLTYLKAVIPPPFSVQESGVKLDIVANGSVSLCCFNDAVGWQASGGANLSVTIPLVIGKAVDFDYTVDSYPPWKNLEAKASGLAGQLVVLHGDLTLSGQRLCGGGLEACLSGTLSADSTTGVDLAGSVNAESEDTGIKYSGAMEARATIDGHLAIKASGCIEKGLTFDLCGGLEGNLFFNGHLTASVPTTDLEVGFNYGGKTIFIQNACLNSDGGDGGAGTASLRPGTLAASTNARIQSVPPVSPYKMTFPFSDFVRSEGDILHDLGVPAAQSGVCATVKLSLTQDLVLTRQGFEATLELTNKQGTALTNIGFTMDVRDALNRPANDRFGVTNLPLTGFTAIDGTGLLAATSTGDSTWRLVPTDDAAPASDQTYYVGGQITYTENGRPLTIPVSNVPIRVRPNAQIKALYFHQRDVFSDDPHTDAIEPSQPFYLGIMLQNIGNGDAGQLKLTSGQPRIVDNEKGLLIDFRVTGSALNGQPQAPSLTMDFGTLAAQSRKVGLWTLESSLQGLFTDYSASFQSLDSNGDPRLSILKSVEIHEMNHLVEVGGALADGLPDFLCNDVPDINDFPDTLYTSDGQVLPVALVTQAATAALVTDAQLSIQLNATMPPNGGWGYLRVADPGAGSYQLVSMVRADGTAIPVGKNTWQTDRTFIGQGQPPRYENFLHLLDAGGSGQYTLTYQRRIADTVPPVSQVSALPAQSPDQFIVSWTGSDAGGIRCYDIYSSTDGGAWALWQSATTATGAVFAGQVGHSYSFYGVATDQAGNREIKAPVAETSTQVINTNAAPVIDGIPQIQLAEGQSLDLAIPASDPDGPLSYAIVAGAPAGMTLSSDGHLHWKTSGADGGSQYSVIVSVTDSGLPQRTSQALIPLVVNEVNTPPAILPVDPQKLTAGETVILQLHATDGDSPV